MKKRNLTVSKLLSITMLSAVLSSATSSGTPFLQAQVVHAEETTPSEGEGDNTQKPEIKEIRFDKTELTLKEGETSTLTVTVVPEVVTPETTTAGAISAGALAWSSSNEDAAKVENGVVTAVKEGTAVIKAALESNPDITASCNVTVTAASTGNPGDGSGDGSGSGNPG
ncbi:MAG: Ig-like domain-containing protein, partial [Eubacterium sp.]|nr:Ig-like domain-containing protein [Eubacterium sp.]